MDDYKVWFIGDITGSNISPTTIIFRHIYNPKNYIEVDLEVMDTKWAYAIYNKQRDNNFLDHSTLVSKKDIIEHIVDKSNFSRKKRINDSRIYYY